MVQSPKFLELHAPAKINLTLEILYRRDDGYHQLRTVLQELTYGDTLILEETPGRRLVFLCDDPRLATFEANLAYRAAALLQERYAPGRSARISLRKRIPVAAGLGGGSSDAAAVLIGLNKFWELGLSREQLHALAAGIGSDVPFFLYGGTALGEGRGEIISPLPPFPHVFVLLVCLPRVTLSTPHVYRALNWKTINTGEKTEKFICLLTEGPIQNGRNGDLLERLLGLMVNDLEPAASGLANELAPLKHKLRQYGLVPFLSGSGPTFFSLSRDPEKLQHVKKKLITEGFGVILTSLVQTREDGGNRNA